MKKIIRIQVLIFFVLILLYGVGFWSISNDQQSRAEIISLQANPPAGMKYYEYCEGGLSDILTTVNDTSCIAERPGDFAKFALAVYMAIFYIISLTIGLGYHLYRNRHLNN